MRIHKPPAETELASWTVVWLEDLGWDIYQEVCGGGGRADIVAKRGSIHWAIECKVGFGLAVIEQALRWKPHVHLASVACWSHTKEFGIDICRHYGIGIISPGQLETTERLRPKLNRHPFKIPKLCEEQKSYAPAGTNGGGWYSPFQRTCRIVAEEVRKNPGITMKDLVNRVDHHYSSAASARQSLKSWIEAKKIPGVEIFYNDANKLCVREGAIPA